MQDLRCPVTKRQQLDYLGKTFLLAYQHNITNERVKLNLVVILVTESKTTQVYVDLLDNNVDNN